MKIKNIYSYVRWSSDKQTWGDSERRQEQMAKDWCARQGYQLSNLSFKDRGTSAWKGKNFQDGALADLLRLVKAHDMILIEDNDRFSREDTITAMVNLKQIVFKGVTVVFLKTGVEVTSKNYNHPSVRGHDCNMEREGRVRLEALWLGTI